MRVGAKEGTLKVGIFIDGGYLQRILKDVFGEPSIDHKQLSEEMARGKDILRTYYYDCLPYQGNPPSQEESRRVSAKQKFFSYLNNLPKYQVQEGTLAYRGRDNNGRPIFVQKGIDVKISVDMLLLAAQRSISEAILVSGDSDLLPAVIGVKNFGVNVTLGHVQSSGV